MQNSFLTNSYSATELFAMGLSVFGVLAIISISIIVRVLIGQRLAANRGV